MRVAPIRNATVLVRVDDDRMRLAAGVVPLMKKLRVRPPGCDRQSGAVESEAETLEPVIPDRLFTRSREHPGRRVGRDPAASMEKTQQEGCL